MNMKKMLAVLCAALLTVGVAACSDTPPPAVDESSTASDLPYRVVFTPPEGYTVVAETSRSITYGIADDAGGFTHEIGVVYIPATEDQKEGIASKDMITMEDGMGADFSASDIKVSFIDIGSYPGIQLDTFEDGNLIEVCYYLILDDWLVMVVTGGDEAYIEEMHTDMKTILDSLTLEELVFG